MSHGEHLSQVDGSVLTPPRSARVTVALPVLPEREGTTGWNSEETAQLGRSLAALLRINRAYLAAFAERDHATILYQHSADAVAELRRKTNGVVPRHPVVTGTAAVDNLREALHQARTAAQWAVLDPALPPDTDWEHLGLHRLASLLPASPGSAALTPLLEHHESGPMLLATIEAYLDLAADARRTAAKLHLHRTTLYYRLGRAQNLLGLDLSDGMVRTQLHLLLKQHRLAEDRPLDQRAHVSPA